MLGCGLVLLVLLGLGVGAGQAIGGVVTAVARAGGLPAPLASDLPVWTGSERVTILVMGLDHREGEPLENARADTMLLLSLDPQRKTAGLLSLPRDLLVTIPLDEKWRVEDRLNTVFVYAYLHDLPGGGPALAKRTVQQLLGIPVQYTAWVDFAGFVRVIDRLGGLTVDVRAPLKDNEFPTPDYRTQRLYIAPGLQHFDGEQALRYVRSRHQDSDFARATRQQQVLLAARERALQLDVLPQLPALLTELRGAVQTDLSPTQLLALARLGREIDPAQLTVRTLPSIPFTTSAGAEVLRLDRVAAARVIAEVLGDPSRPALSASVEVLNGTTIPGLATRTAAFLQQQGLTVLRYDTAPEARVETAIYAASGKRQVAEVVASLIGVPVDRVREAPGTAGVDIRVILGRDAKDPHP